MQNLNGMGCNCDWLANNASVNNNALAGNQQVQSAVFQFLESCKSIWEVFLFSFNNPGAIWHFEEVFTETFRWGLHPVAVYSFTQHVKVHWFNSSWKHKFLLGLVSGPLPNKTEFPTCNEPLLARGWKCFVQLNPIYSSM